MATDDYLEVLIVDFHTLHAVNILNLVDNVLLHSRRPHDVKDVGRCSGAVRQRGTGTYIVVFLHKNLLRKRHKVFLFLAKFGGD